MNFSLIHIHDHNCTTLGFQIDHTVRKKLHGWTTIHIDSGSRATEMRPNIKATDIWLSALEKLFFANCCCSSQNPCIFRAKLSTN